ncbi:MAG: cytidine deaminase [Rikenellaceae bacterium]
MEKSFNINYSHFDCYDDMSTSDRELIELAKNGARHSCAPYSNFSVGAALRLSSGEVEFAANVESEVYPAGICAERNLLFNTAVRHPNETITAIAIISISTTDECYPCGLCRQTLLDTERRQGAPIRIIMAGGESVTVVDSAALLLPFGFKLK